MNKQTEELEHNELVDWLDKKFGHLRPYAKQIGFGLVALLALFFAVAFLIKSRWDLHALQWQNLSSALNAFYIDNQTSHLFNLADEYPEMESSMWALLIGADVEVQVGLNKLNSDPVAAIKNLDKGKKAYERLLASSVKRSPELEQRAQFGLAFAQESLGEFDAAKGSYQKILDQAPDSIYGEPARQALDRLANPDFVAFYAAYKRTSVAPIGELPPRPDISFPEIETPPPATLPTSGGETPADKTEPTSQELPK